MIFLSSEKKEDLQPGQIVWIIPDFKNLHIVWEIPVIAEWLYTNELFIYSNKQKRYKLGVDTHKDRICFFRNRDEIYDTQEEALEALEKILLSEKDKVNKEYEGRINRVSTSINTLRNKLKGLFQ